MPIEHRYDADLDTVFVTASGTISQKEMLEVGAKLAADPSVPVGHKELIDLRDLATGDFTARDVRELADIFQGHDKSPQGSQVAVVAPADWAYGISRMYQTYRDGSPSRLQVFREVAEARAWLGLPPG